MPLLAADPVIVEPAQREALEALVRAHSTSQQLALRARMILQAADDVGVRESARELEVWPKTVRYWRGRCAGKTITGSAASQGITISPLSFRFVLPRRHRFDSCFVVGKPPRSDYLRTFTHDGVATSARRY